MNPALEIGKTFGGGRYVVERVLGIGGFAIVWFVIKKKTWADFLALFKK